jgi:dTDP-4-amino-4,6-dideoxygalactose transaminase
METPIIKVGTLTVSERAKEYVRQVLGSNRLSYGPFTMRFEEKFAHLHGCRFGVMTNSGTSALTIALAALKEQRGWRDGDEVLVPAVTFIATSNCVLHNNLRPVFVDVEKDYYGIDPSRIEARITPRTRAVLPVHLFGLPCAMDPILEIARSRRLGVIEDSCETMFARYRGRWVGGLGDIGCFSTYVAHLIVTGVGGLCTTNDPECAVALRSLLNHGRDSIYISIDDDENKTREEMRMIVARRFSFVSLGHSYRVTEMEGALGLAQLETWEEMIARRRRNARYLTEGLRDLEDRIQLPAIRPECEHSFMMYPIVLREESKENLVNYLEEHGVETREMFPLITQPVYRRLFRLDPKDYPAADWINRGGFYVGCHQDLSSVDLDYLIGRFHSYFSGRPREKAARNFTLVIATFDSLDLSRQVFDSIPREMFNQLVVVDRGSSDGTPEFWEEKKVPVSVAPDPFPAGAALAAGEGIVFFELDGSKDPEDIHRLRLLLDQGYDLVIASRLMPGGHKSDYRRSIPFRGLGNRFFSLLANVLFNGNLTDPLNTFRAVRKASLARLGLDASGLGYHYQMSIRAMEAGWKVIEIPTRESVKSREDVGYKIAWSVFHMVGILVKELWKGRVFRRPGAAD